MKFAGTTPKLGNAAAECDDRYSSRGGRFAVADGTSEGGYSRIWARILAEEFCRSNGSGLDSDAVDAWLGSCCAAWRKWAAQTSRRNIPWFARATLHTGAFATFVGLRFSKDRDGTWTAIARGDSCVFVVRDDDLDLAFPVSESGRFDNSPPLVPTSGALRGDAMQVTTGSARPGDAFYLVTDALAQWFLAGYERGEKPWAALSRVRSQRELTTFVAASRRSHALKNDDVTLMSIVMKQDE